MLFIFLFNFLRDNTFANFKVAYGRRQDQILQWHCKVGGFYLLLVVNFGQLRKSTNDLCTSITLLPGLILVTEAFFCQV